MAEQPSKKAMTNTLKIVLVGGGNSTHVFAALAANSGHHVSILTRREKDWREDKVVTCENQDPGWLDGITEIKGTVSQISGDAKALVSDADMIVLCGLPVHLYREALKNVCPHIKRDGVMLGTVCAYGGFSWLVKEVMGKELASKITLFGTQSIPWTCGTIKYGDTGAVFGAKRTLHVALEGADVCTVSSEPLVLLQSLFRNAKVEPTDFWTCTLWPNNPLFHPTVLWGLFEDWDMETPFKKSELPTFIYADVTRKSAQAIEDMDAELQLITKAMRAKFPDNKYLDMAKPLKQCLVFHYAELIKDTTDIYSILRSNVAYSKHKITYKEAGEGLVIPDVTHKFFTTDLPYGLCIYKDLAIKLEIDVPCIDKLIYWNQKMVSKEFMVDGQLTGKHIGEAVLPTKFEDL